MVGFRVCTPFVDTEVSLAFVQQQLAVCVGLQKPPEFLRITRILTVVTTFYSAKRFGDYLRISEIGGMRRVC